MVGFLLIGMFFGLIPAAVAQTKHRNFIGWWIFGTFLWPIAVFFILMLSPVGRKCPHCRGRIQQNATVCKYCGRNLIIRQNPPPIPLVEARKPPEVPAEPMFVGAKLL